MSDTVHDLVAQNAIRLGRELAVDLHRYESTLDQAVQDGMYLMQKVLERHRSAGVSRVAVQPVLAHLARSMATAVEASGEVVGAHVEIRKMGDRRGFKEVSWGELCDPRPQAAAVDRAA